MRTRPALAAAGSALLVASGTATSSAAHAALLDAPAALPPAGSGFWLIENGNMVLECEGTVYRFDLHGTGQLRVGPEIAGDSPTTVVTTDSEELAGWDPVLGTVDVSEKAPTAGEIVEARKDQPFPAAETIAQNLTVSMEHNPCDPTGHPATYTTKDAFPLVNTNLTAFPPQNAVYQPVGDPVELLDESDPAAPSVFLTSFPLSVDSSTPANGLNN